MESEMENNSTPNFGVLSIKPRLETLVFVQIIWLISTILAYKTNIHKKL
jgi:hypothetical protein